jgi:polyferredoxin
LSDIHQAIQFISGMLAPAIMISSCGLILLGLQTKYSNIIDRIRDLNEEKRRLELMESLDRFQERRMRSLSAQMEKLLIRAKLDRNGILSLYLAILSFVLTSLLIAPAYFGYLGLVTFSIIFFVIGIGLVLTGIIYVALEVSNSYKVVKYEVET